MPGSERFYRLLLRAYPRHFRARYEQEMVAWFREHRRTAASAGVGRFAFWTVVLLDLAASVPAEHVRTLSPTGRTRKEVVREPTSTEGRGGRMGEALLQDLRIAVRSFVTRPSFFLIAVLTIAVGVGAITTIFTVVDGVILRPLPYPDADRLMRVGQASDDPDRLYAMSYLDFKDIQAEDVSFEALAATRVTRVTVLGDGPPEAYLGAFVSPEFFRVLGVSAASGRVFTNQEDIVEAPVAVLSHGLWQRRWEGDPELVGKTIATDDGALTVVGIMPPGFRAPEALGQASAELWMPLSRVDRNARDSRRDSFLMGIGRLADGTESSAARDELEAIGAQIREAYPAESGDHRFGIAPLHSQTVGAASRTLTPLFGAVVLLLLIACANVANLFLVRASERRREFSLRRAVGANRGRLLRQVMTEGVLLGACGGALGAVLAVIGVEAFVRANPGDLPRLTEVALDGSVVVFALFVSFAASVLFSIVPAMRSAEAGVASALGSGTRGGGSTLRDERLRNGVVVAEIGLALVLVIGAGLLVNSFVRLNQVELGLDPTNVYAMQVTYAGESTTDETRLFFDELIDGVAEIPGVVDAGATAVLPVSGGYMYQSLTFDGEPTPDDDRYSVKYQEVTPGYFDALSIPVIRGRGIEDGDDPTSDLVAVISESMAGEVFGDIDPLGHTLSLGDRGLRDGVFTIVGVVGDTRLRGLADAPEPELYLAFAQAPRTRMDVVVRTRSSDAGVLTAMRDRVWALRPDLPVSRSVVLEDHIAESIAPSRFYTALLAGFASAALLLALIGIYGTLAYTVTQRAHEVGVRMAIGATARGVQRMVIRRGLVLALAGVLVGLAVALPLSRVLESMVFGVSPTDPLTIASAVGAIALATIGASLLPARRATRLDPVEVLRNE